MTDPRDAKMDAVAEELAEAGLIEVITDAEGHESYKLTPEGERAAKQLAMSDETGLNELLKGLLGHEE